MILSTKRTAPKRFRKYTNHVKPKSLNKKQVKIKSKNLQSVAQNPELDTFESMLKGFDFQGMFQKYQICFRFLHKDGSAGRQIF